MTPILIILLLTSLLLGAVALTSVIVDVTLRIPMALVLRRVDSYLRDYGADRYVQVIAMPIIYTMCGGFASTGVALLVTNESGHASHSHTAGVLIVLAILLAVAGPMFLDSLTSRPAALATAARLHAARVGQDDFRSIRLVVQARRNALSKPPSPLAKRALSSILALGVVIPLITRAVYAGYEHMNGPQYGIPWNMLAFLIPPLSILAAGLHWAINSLLLGLELTQLDYWEKECAAAIKTAMPGEESHLASILRAAL